jgi:cell division septum initiation protein DivIVA
MSDDIVERLRDRGVCGNDHGDAKHLMLDAADEIERLRAENANLQWQLDFLRSQIEQDL